MISKWLCHLNLIKYDLHAIISMIISENWAHHCIARGGHKANIRVMSI